ncbi:unnamed protein product [Staurois parvus]|uniref:Uncharacterized protein n=1 Tax=Staurois parvus TaxID=386267 RepID=A0ABN9EQX6_9NEOB|nr:unnamed protein product [Staurois parvus]
MIGTSYRGPVPRSVFHCVRRERAQLEKAGAVYGRQPDPGLPPPCRL